MLVSVSKVHTGDSLVVFVNVWVIFPHDKEFDVGEKVEVRVCERLSLKNDLK